MDLTVALEDPETSDLKVSLEMTDPKDHLDPQDPQEFPDLVDLWDHLDFVC